MSLEFRENSGLGSRSGGPSRSRRSLQHLGTNFSVIVLSSLVDHMAIIAGYGFPPESFPLHAEEFPFLQRGPPQSVPTPINPLTPIPSLHFTAFPYCVCPIPLSSLVLPCLFHAFTPIVPPALHGPLSLSQESHPLSLFHVLKCYSSFKANLKYHLLHEASAPHRSKGSAATSRAPAVV